MSTFGEKETLGMHLKTFVGIAYFLTEIEKNPEILDHMSIRQNFHKI